MHNASQPKPKVIVTRRLPRAIEERMTALFDVTLNETDEALTQEQLAHAAANCDILVPTVTDRIDADVIQAGQNTLKLIANFGAGVDHIDLNTAQSINIPVTNTPGVLTNDTADIAMALLLAVPRRLFEAEKILRAGKWDGWSPTFMMGTRLEGKKLGIVGMGRIGRAVAKRAHAFGLEIHYHNRRALPQDTETQYSATYWPDLDNMISEMDFISINCPLTDDTYHLFDRDRLAKFAPHTILINTARGDIIDEDALADFLTSGHIKGAGLDVYEHEPKINEKLLGLDNVVLVPHMGSATLEARVAMGEKVLINIRTFVDGHRLPDRVLPTGF